MMTVITYGTFDLLHYGHVRLLRRIRGLGDRLVVGLSTDEFNKEKGKKVIIPFEHRKEILESIKFVDHVFAEKSWSQKRIDIKREEACILAMGDDWAGKFDDLEDVVKVLYLPRTDNVSTTEIKEALKTFDQDSMRQVNRALEQAQEIVSRFLV